MNQTFDFRRWWMLVTLHWVENRKRYGLGLLAIAGLLIAWFSFLLTVDKFSALDLGYQFSAYFVGLYFIGCLLSGTIFSELGDKRQGIGYLSLPASHLEKLLCALLFSIVFFFIAFTLVFYLVDIPFVHAANNLVGERYRTSADMSSVPYTTPVYNILTASGAPMLEQDGHLLLTSYFAFQSVYMLGSVYFTRSAFIKTTVAVLLFMLIYVSFVSEGVGRQLPPGWFIKDLFQWQRGSSLVGQGQWVKLPLVIECALKILVSYGIPVLFWVIAFFRLREKEV
jgi:hypothetical protein